ncbi:hypothetical protein G4G28_05300 [Massilia sp. Dwa41.01b]|uniref:hypothetical protein n=1 Tax=unclassified Massilia TaxID=2609279 RepID=UPI0016000960|nr:MULTISPECIES: hypothetical protein [unclassified Massilia]QNA88043.1 hypothetical protein G4G28_05300 [Massilia sp. Dwa41.01b]QNA98948.1 hypothetical protein G4G31_09020 [Massilia sp. Se16.2.3]
MNKTVVIGVILAMSTAVAIGGGVEPTPTDKITIETTTDDTNQTSPAFEEESAAAMAEASDIWPGLQDNKQIK